MPSRENSGALFKNDKKETDKHPDFNGHAVIGGAGYWISAWAQVYEKDGEKRRYFSLSFKEKDAAAPRGAKKSTPPTDDDIPF